MPQHYFLVNLHNRGEQRITQADAGTGAVRCGQAGEDRQPADPRLSAHTVRELPGSGDIGPEQLYRCLRLRDAA